MKEKHITQQISQSDFFGLCNQQLKSIITSSKVEQDRLKTIKKIEQLRNTNPDKQMHCADKLLDNIVVDYLNTHHLSYTYSVFMRERNLISEQVSTKLKLVQLLHLQNTYQSTSRLDISILEMLMVQQSNEVGKIKGAVQIGSQVDLLGKTSVVNHQLINELRISQARKQVQANQKKHYEQLLSRMREQLTITIKDDMKRQFQLKMKTIKSEYEQQVKLLKQKNKEFLMNNPKLNPKIEEYLTKIEKLQSHTADLTQTIKTLQREKVTHNCSKNQSIVQKQQQLRQQKQQLEARKKQYDLALRCIHTSVEQLALKKQNINKESKPTDIFINDIKKNKVAKDHMIEQIYGRLFIMDKRVETLSKDNQSLMEENRQLLCKVKQLQTNKQDLSQKYNETSKKQEQLKKITIRAKTKDVMIGVRQEQIRQSTREKKEHVIDEIQDEDSDEEERVIDNKNKYKLQINSIYSEMRSLKNNLRLTVQSFE